MALVLNDGYLLEGDAGDAAQVDYTVTGLDGTTLKMLASGQLAGAKATLYEASGIDTVAGITLFNTGAATAINLYVNDGTSRQVLGITSLGASFTALFDGGKLAVFNTSGVLQVATTALAHASSHENGGADEISVAGLSGELADDQPAKAHTASHTNGTDDIQSATNAQKGLATDAHIILLESAVQSTDFEAKGNILVGTGDNLYSVLNAGTNNQILSANNGEATGLAWIGGSYLSALEEDTSPQLGGDLDLNQFSIELDPTPTDDDTGQGLILTMTVDANAVGVGCALYMAADGHFDEADADAEATMPCIACALETGTGSKKVLFKGVIRNDGWNWTSLGQPVYVSVTQGTFSQTTPGSGKFSQRIGIAIAADVILFDPDMTVIEEA